MIYAGDPSAHEVVFRVLLFKFFNRIDTWQLLVDGIGEVRYAGYEASRYVRILTDAADRGAALYSGAYIIPSGSHWTCERRKHRMHLELLSLMMSEQVPSRVCEARTLGQVFDLLTTFPSIGEFLGFQFAVDLNYSALISFDENDFVVAGPGARDGIRKCFTDLGDYTDADVIRHVCDQQETEFERLGLDFQGLFGRALRLVDCQNLFCEVDKYFRVTRPDLHGFSHRSRMKRLFRPEASIQDYWFPPKWGINSPIPSPNAE